jgi:FKBP-type peptidyl-prolyl cis-trans isomerase FkpA
VETLMTSRQALAQAASSSAGEALLAAAAKEDGAITTASGLVYSELLPGDGASPKPGAQVGLLGRGEEGRGCRNEP